MDKVRFQDMMIRIEREKLTKGNRAHLVVDNFQITLDLQSAMAELTKILSQAHSGDPKAAEKLLPLVYDELRRLAVAKLAQEKPGQTLQATALVHEAYLRLIGKDGAATFDNRKHFFGAAAEAMRRILVDQARRKMSVRHGGDWQRIDELCDVPDIEQEVDQTIAVHELLDDLAAKHLRQAEVAKMRMFLKLTFVEIGDILAISADSAENDWRIARAWLRREWNGNDPKS